MDARITISKSLTSITKEQVEASLLAKGIKMEKFKQFKAIRVIGDALDTATGKGLHGAAFSEARRELIINAYPVNGAPYIVIRVFVGEI